MSLSSESSSQGCSSICPSDLLCSKVLGLRVAVAVGLGGNPLRGKVLTGEGSGRSVSTGMDATGGISICDTLVVVVAGTSVVLLLSGAV